MDRQIGSNHQFYRHNEYARLLYSACVGQCLNANVFLSVSAAWIVWIEHPLFEPIDTDDSGISNTAVTFVFLFLITLFYSIGATFVKVYTFLAHFQFRINMRSDFMWAFELLIIWKKKQKLAWYFYWHLFDWFMHVRQKLFSLQ